MPMVIPIDFMIINKLLLSLLVQWQHIKDLVAFMVSKVEGLFHFENINFQGRADYMHQYHPVEKDVHPSLAPGKHLILFQNRCGDDLVHLDNLNCPIKRKVVQHLHTSKKLQIMDFSHECVEMKKRNEQKKIPKGQSILVQHP
jgi:hypothetical protein